jgi:hypothetical protein
VWEEEEKFALLAVVAAVVALGVPVVKPRKAREAHQACRSPLGCAILRISVEFGKQAKIFTLVVSFFAERFSDEHVVAFFACLTRCSVGLLIMSVWRLTWPVVLSVR